MNFQVGRFLVSIMSILTFSLGANALDGNCRLLLSTYLGIATESIEPTELRDALDKVEDFRTGSATPFSYVHKLSPLMSKGLIFKSLIKVFSDGGREAKIRLVTRSIFYVSTVIKKTPRVCTKSYHRFAENFRI